MTAREGLNEEVLLESVTECPGFSLQFAGGDFAASPDGRVRRESTLQEVWLTRAFPLESHLVIVAKATQAHANAIWAAEISWECRAAVQSITATPSHNVITKTLHPVLLLLSSLQA